MTKILFLFLQSAAIGVTMSIFLLTSVIMMSPVFLKYQLGGRISNYGEIVFCSVALVFTIIHSILNFVAPSQISSTPKCIKILSRKPNSNGTTDLVNGYNRLMQQTGGSGSSEQMTTTSIRINIFVFVSTL